MTFNFVGFGGVSAFKKTAVAGLMTLALLGPVQSVQAAHVTGDNTYHLAASVEDNSLQDRAVEGEGTDYEAQSVMTSTSTEQPRMSENAQVLVLIGMLIVIHVGSSWVMKRVRQDKET